VQNNKRIDRPTHRGASRRTPGRDLVAAARNSWIVCFDNLSHLPEELADAACRLATGGGFGGRELYSDHDEAIFDATGPMGFNAIPDLGAARPDFLDRSVIVEFLDMKSDMRCDEAQFWREFEEARPRVLGALLDAAAAGLTNLPNVSLVQPSQMADFAIWVSACEESLGMKPGEALAAYQSNRAETDGLALESSPLYEPVAQLAKEGFSGTVTELHARLTCMVSESMPLSVRWPKAPNALGNALRRMAVNLRAAGIEIQFSRADVRGRHVVSVIRCRDSEKIVSHRQ
jgi:putative DNA primase/helicase